MEKMVKCVPEMENAKVLGLEKAMELVFVILDLMALHVINVQAVITFLIKTLRKHFVHHVIIPATVIVQEQDQPNALLVVRDL